jgi:hypothetical protein
VNVIEKMRTVKSLKLTQMIGLVNRVKLVKLNKQ